MLKQPDKHELASKPVFAELRHEQKAHLEATSRDLSSQCLVQLAKTLDKARAYIQAAGIYGLLRTHERLDAGEATQNVEIHSKLEVAGLDKFCEMLSDSLIISRNNSGSDGNGGQGCS